jgi:hypothetical protein
MTLYKNGSGHHVQNEIVIFRSTALRFVLFCSYSVKILRPSRRSSIESIVSLMSEFTTVFSFIYEFYSITFLQ